MKLKIEIKETKYYYEMISNITYVYSRSLIILAFLILSDLICCYLISQYTTSKLLLLVSAVIHIIYIWKFINRFNRLRPCIRVNRFIQNRDGDTVSFFIPDEDEVNSILNSFEKIGINVINYEIEKGFNHEE